MVVTLLDDKTRPKAPKIDGVTEAERRRGRRLALIHELYLRELAGVRRAMEEVERGEATPEALTDAVRSMAMLDNYRRFGALCGRGCQALTVHHTIEDQMLFPSLENKDRGLRKVIERLRAEHEVIHHLLEQLEEAARAAFEEPDSSTFNDLRAVYETLEPVVVSHFAYEQTELEEAIGYYNVGI